MSLVAVLVASAVLVSVVVTVTLLAVGEAQSSLALTAGEQNLQLVEGCTEDLLQKVHDFARYSLPTISRPEGTCQITYNQSGPVNWEVTVKSSAVDYQRQVRVTFTRGTKIEIVSWQEI